MLPSRRLLSLAAGLAALAAPHAAFAQVQPVAGPAPAPAAAAPVGRIIQETWYDALLGGKHAGYSRTVVFEFETNGRKFWRAQRELNLSLRRFNDIITTKLTVGSDETPEGEVKGVFMIQELGAQKQQTLYGKVEGNQLVVKADGNLAQFEKRVPWDPKAVGLLGEERLLAKLKPEPGAKFDYRIYDPMLNALVTVRGEVAAREALAPGRPPLLKVVGIPEKIQDIRLPSTVSWFDAQYTMIRSRSEFPGIGLLIMDACSREQALRPADPASPDLGLSQSIPLKSRIDQPHQAASIVWKVKLPLDDQPAKAFAVDGLRQEVRNINADDHSFELVVRAPTPLPTEEPPTPTPADKQYTESNFFITSADPLVKRHAATAVGLEQDSWRKAVAIERWVSQNMRSLNFTEAMVPADRVAQTLSGDCTEYAMLAAAMCRAAGVPSRTAVGLVYAEPNGGGGKPMLSFHMWFEVLVRGKWVGLDATLGKSGIGPGHLKVSDHSWYETRTMTPILPLMRVMLGDPSVEVANVVPR